MLPGLVLALLVVLAGTLAYTGWIGPVVLIVASVVWLRVNGPMEGRVLHVISPGHGVTAGDLAAVAGVLVALVRLAVLTSR